MKELDTWKILRRGWDAFAADVVPLTAATLIMIALGVLTIGILFPVLVAGIYKMALTRAREGRAPKIGDVFSCFENFWGLTIGMFVIGLLVGLGFLACIIPGVYLAIIWVYALPFMVDRRVPFGEAMSLSSARVKEWGFASHLVVLLVLGIICMAVGMVPLAGLLATPFSVACIIAMYITVIGTDGIAAAPPVVKPPAGIEPVAPPPVQIQPGKCTACGAELASGAAFCPYCGARQGNG